jgi:hypothetical protein
MNESQPSSQPNTGVTAHGDAQAVEKLREASIRLKAEIGKVVMSKEIRHPQKYPRRYWSHCDWIP